MSAHNPLHNGARLRASSAAMVLRVVMFCYGVNYFNFCNEKKKSFTIFVMCFNIHPLTKEMVPKQKIRRMKMATLKKGYYQAETTNGVYFIGDILDDEDQDVTDARSFADSLKTLGDDEVIVAFFDESTADIFEEIDSEYGIK